MQGRFASRALCSQPWCQRTQTLCFFTQPTRHLSGIPGRSSSNLFGPTMRSCVAPSIHGSSHPSTSMMIASRLSQPSPMQYTQMRFGNMRRFGRTNTIGAKKWRLFKKFRRSWTPWFQNSPHRKAVVEVVLIKQPRKPNSGKRQVIKATIRTAKRTVFAYVPFEKYPLSKWNRVLIEGWRPSDVPFTHARCIRGKYDLPPPQKRGSANRPSLKRLPGTKIDKTKRQRVKYYKTKSTVVPDIHTFMV